MKNKSILLLPLITILTGCSFFSIKDSGEQTPNNNTPSNNNGDENNQTQNPDNGNNNNNNNTDDPNAVVPTTNKTFLDFFNYNSKVEIELKFTNQSITKLKEYAEGEGNSNFIRNEMYHPCTATITVNGASQTFEEAGARMKGNLSRDTDFVDNNGHFDTNHLCHFKLSFNQTFDDSSFYYTHNWGNDTDGKKEKTANTVE